MLQDLGNYIGGKLQDLLKTEVTDKVVEGLINDICRHLVLNNVNPEHIIMLRERLKKEINIREGKSDANKAKIVQNAVFACLMDFVDSKVDCYEVKRNRTNTVVFVGLQGAGKTTSICKYANFYKKKKFKVGIVCADTYRAGAFDQVKQNAGKINVPFFGSNSTNSVEVAKEGVQRFKDCKFELILVDTSGRHTQEEELFVEMKDIVGEIKPDNVVFVMDAAIGQSAQDQAIGFKEAVGFGGIILTKLDGTSKAGGALSSVAAAKCPIEFIGTGEGMEDFERFDAKRFISKLLGRGDLEGLYEKISGIDIDEEELTNKIMQGKMSMGDYYGYYKKILSLGPLSSIMSMVPGGKNLPMPDEQKFRKINYVFDSMSKSELKSHGDIFQKESSRIRRLSRGSGVSVSEIQEILGNYKMMNTFLKKASSIIPGFENMLAGNKKSDGKISEKDFEKQIDDMNKLFSNTSMPSFSNMFKEMRQSQTDLNNSNNDELY